MDEVAFNNHPYPRAICSELPPLSADKTHKDSKVVSMELYPNPNQGQFTIRLGYHKIGYTGTGKLSIIDLSGRVIYNKQVHIVSGDQEIRINKTQLMSGLYIVLLEVNNEGYKAKLIIE